MSTRFHTVITASTSMKMLDSFKVACACRMPLQTYSSAGF